MTPNHQCHFDDCEIEVPRRMLFCYGHWKMVSLAVRRAVWAAYRPGQETGGASPTPAYFDAVDRAKADVRKKLGRTTP